jgi:peroxiredoxin
MGTEFVRAGQPAPKFKMKAIGSGREISAEALVGHVSVLIFVNQETQRDGRGIIKAIREEYPSAAEVLIVTVVDLSPVPIILKGMAENFLKESYQKSAARLTEGSDPATYVVILPDWKGELLKAFGVKAVNRQPAFVVIDSKGVIAGSYQGDAPGPAAIPLLAGLVT